MDRTPLKTLGADAADRPSQEGGGEACAAAEGEPCGFPYTSL
jgi:hypothetical protein